MVAIRRAVRDDIPRIMRFMDEHWKRGHILARDRDFFDWQFVYGDRVNMFIGVDDGDGRIYGMIGAVVYSAASSPDVSGCTWQVIPSGNPALGLELIEYMKQYLNVRHNCASGLSQKSVRINRLQGIVPAALDHYYRLADREDYRIALVTDKAIPAVGETGFSLERIDSPGRMREIVSEQYLADRVLSKDYAYIERRYFRHPVYHYDVWGVVDGDGDARSVLITRDELVGDRRACKIVDHYGSEGDLGMVAPALDRLMDERQCEFVDVYSYGVPTEIYERGGFVRCGGDGNVIPNYFHPFVRENVELLLVDPRVRGLRLFRGDGDQDRPC